MWRFSGKNIYFKDTSVAKEVEKRINELGGKVVNLQSPIPIINLVCYKDMMSLEKENNAFSTRQRIQSRRKQEIVFISLDTLQESMGYDDTLPFSLWSQLPNYDPWTGKRVYPTRYNDNLIEEINVEK